MRHTAITMITLAALGLPGAVGAQSIASRVNSVREGDVRLTFPLRPGVCGYGRNVWYGDRSNYNRNDERQSPDVEYDVDCNTGPGRLVVVRRDGETTDIRFHVGGRWRPSSTATDLGMVGTRSAVDFLINLAEA